MSFSQVDGGIIDGPIDDIIQLGITLNTGDLNLVLQCKVALVDNTQCGKLIAAARLPKNLVGGSIVFGLESKGLTLGGDPVVAIFHFKSNIKVARLNFVNRSRSSVGEPRKGGADEHCNA